MMSPVSARTLSILAALVWYIGGVVLLMKSASLLAEATSIEPGGKWPRFAVLFGICIGGIKARFIFSRSCDRNLARIRALKTRRPWNFFRGGFFFFLLLMIATGATLSRLAHGNYVFLISVAALDLTIATALLGSSYVFWKRRAFTE